MTFVLLDNKEWCKGIYHRGSLHLEEIPKTISRGWKYANYLKDFQVEYASIYAQGKTIDQICPKSLLPEWLSKTKKMKAFKTSFEEAKLPLDEVCFYDLVPQQFLLELCDLKCNIIEDYLDNNQKPKNYDFLFQTEKLITEISSRTLNLDLEWLKKNLSDNRARLLFSKIKNKNNDIQYNLFGSKTGRLTTKPNTFPILNLDTKLRSVIKPNNDFFLELDFNAAEIRVLLGLTEQPQPTEDIHSWNAKRLGMKRDEVKTEIFAWLYGSTKVDNGKYEKMFELNKIIDKFYHGNKITNIYNREIYTDSYHKINYLIQSTTADLVLDQANKVNQILQNKKSYISFIVHDSIVIDLSKEDREIASTIIEKFSETRLGNFPVNISIGKDYGSLRKL